ncbi:hypothetical protein [Streptosporangium roseum]|uniref:hypothetical protein n=1 Tax=Streptosporangium roseum TaxID=2001 RepID=UPI00331B2300
MRATGFCSTAGGAALRADSFTFDQIAAVLALDHSVSPLRLYRYAHGRTASDVVLTYNDLDPAGTAALREARLYDYEAWPQGGRRASAGAIAIFARIYQTTARRLLSAEAYASFGVLDRDLLDPADHRHLDPHHLRRMSVPVVHDGSETVFPRGQMSVPVVHDGLATVFPRGQMSDPVLRGSMEAEAVPARALAVSPAPTHCAGLLRALSAEEADVRRRELLFELALLLGGAPALGLLRHLTPSEQERLAAATRHQKPVDGVTIGLLERLTAKLWEMDESMGPRQVLPVAEAKRALVEDLLKQGSLTPAPRDRLLRLYWSLSHMTGWCHYDLMDYSGAARRYSEGLAAAHELGAPVLLAHLHGLLADMALYQGRPTVAMDHAFAAQGWAKNSGNRLQQAAAFSIFARALSSTRRDEEGLRVLDRAIELTGGGRSGAELRHLFWLEPSRIACHAVFCLIKAGRFDRAMVEAEQKLAAMGSISVRVRSILRLEYASVLVQKREIPAAAAMIDKVAQTTTAHTSVRLVDSVRQARARLQPWADNRHVRDLDERLHALSVVGQSH